MNGRDPRAAGLLRDHVLALACDEIMAEAGRAELARFDDLLGGAIASNPESWRGLAAARDAALAYAAALARAGFVAGLGRMVLSLTLLLLIGAGLAGCSVITGQQQAYSAGQYARAAEANAAGAASYARAAEATANGQAAIEREAERSQRLAYFLGYMASPAARESQSQMCWTFVWLATCAGLLVATLWAWAQRG